MCTVGTFSSQASTEILRHPELRGRSPWIILWSMVLCIPKLEGPTVASHSKWSQLYQLQNWSISFTQKLPNHHNIHSLFRIFLMCSPKIQPSGCGCCPIRTSPPWRPGWGAAERAPPSTVPSAPPRTWRWLDTWAPGHVKSFRNIKILYNIYIVCMVWIYVNTDMICMCIYIYIYIYIYICVCVVCIYIYTFIHLYSYYMIN